MGGFTFFLFFVLSLRASWLWRPGKWFLKWWKVLNLRTTSLLVKSQQPPWSCVFVFSRDFILAFIFFTFGLQETNEGEVKKLNGAMRLGKKKSVMFPFVSPRSPSLLRRSWW